MATVLVTGANGFIGSHLAIRLVEMGHLVYGLHRRKISNNPMYNNLVKQGKIQVVTADISNLNVNELPKVDYIFHVAGKVSVWGKLKDFRNINVNGTKKLLEYARNMRVKCFTYFSTSAVYGFYGYKNITEEASKKPFKNPYSISKLETENLVQNFSTQNNLNYVIIRPCNVYGEYDYTSSHEIYTRVSKEKMMISAGGKYESCFVYVGNLVEAAIQTTFGENTQNTDYNVSDNNDSLKTYLTNVATEFGVKPKFKNFPAPIAKLVACAVEGIYKIFFIKKAPLITRFSIYQNCADYSFSIEKLKQIGYLPKYSTKQGIKNTVQWIKGINCERKN